MQHILLIAAYIYYILDRIGKNRTMTNLDVVPQLRVPGLVDVEHEGLSVPNRLQHAQFGASVSHLRVFTDLQLEQFLLSIWTRMRVRVR